MKAATIAQLKKELRALSPEALVEHCLRLAKYKKDNKELLSYLIFIRDNELEYVDWVKEEVGDMFEAINTTNLYYAKKGIRKALRRVNQCIKYSGQIPTEIELRMFFLEQMNQMGIAFERSTAMVNLYNRQLEAIQKAIGKLHEDLQFDFSTQLEERNLRFL